MARLLNEFESPYAYAYVKRLSGGQLRLRPGLLENASIRATPNRKDKEAPTRSARDTMGSSATRGAGSRRAIKRWAGVCRNLVSLTKCSRWSQRRGPRITMHEGIILRHARSRPPAVARSAPLKI
jgi:hypothetical protein